MQRILFFIFLGAFLHLIGFIENLWVLKSVGTGKEGDLEKTRKI